MTQTGLARVTFFYPGKHGSLVEGGPTSRHRVLVVTPDMVRRGVGDGFVTVACDYQKFRDDAEIWFDVLPGVYRGLRFKLRDTGGNFYGKGKKVRTPGAEPFDLALDMRFYGRMRSPVFTPYKVEV